jgi:hypothetical protein
MSRIGTKSPISVASAIPTVKALRASIRLLNQRDRLKLMEGVIKDMADAPEPKQLSNQEETLARLKSAKEGNVVSMPPGPVTAQSLTEFARGV